MRSLILDSWWETTYEHGCCCKHLHDKCTQESCGHSPPGWNSHADKLAKSRFWVDKSRGRWGVFYHRPRGQRSFDTTVAISIPDMREAAAQGCALCKLLCETMSYAGLKNLSSKEYISVAKREYSILISFPVRKRFSVSKSMPCKVALSQSPHAGENPQGHGTMFGRPISISFGCF